MRGREILLRWLQQVQLLPERLPVLHLQALPRSGERRGPRRFLAELNEKPSFLSGFGRSTFNSSAVVIVFCAFDTKNLRDACNKKEHISISQHLNGKQAPELRKCVPGKSYFDGCNRCSCLANGSHTCARIGCPGQERVEAPDDFWLKN